MEGFGTWDAIQRKPELFAAAVPICGGGDVSKAYGNPRYTEYPNVGHFSWINAYSDPELFEWLFSQKKNNDSKSNLKGKRCFHMGINQF
jgi:predicted peptidase